jgi:hypothetical protein
LDSTSRLLDINLNHKICTGRFNNLEKYANILNSLFIRVLSIHRGGPVGYLSDCLWQTIGKNGVPISMVMTATAV